ncbi:MAG: hypothetical protein U0230_21775 [Polyangiales bacterium]
METIPLSLDATLDPPRTSFAARILGHSASPDVREALFRLSSGLGLAWLFGLALGAGHPSASWPAWALGIAAGPLACVAAGLPSLLVLLTLFDVRISLAELFDAAARGIATTGMLLAGLAPLVLLYVGTARDSVATDLVASVSLGAAGLAGLSATIRAVLAVARAEGETSKAALSFLSAGYAVFAALLLGRLWLRAALVLANGGLHVH